MWAGLDRRDLTAKLLLQPPSINRHFVEKMNSGTDGGVPEERWDLAEYALSFASDRRVPTSQIAARCYGFTIAERHFLLDEGQAAELISQPSFTPMPNSPDHCLGLANIRGNIVPYYTIRALTNPAPEQALESHRYALLLGDVISGVLLAIDAKPVAVPRDALMQNSQSLSNLGEIPSSIIRNHYSALDRHWLMLDCVKLVQFLASADGVSE